MGRKFPYSDREDWQDNSYGIDKNEFDNEIDYMEAIEEAILDIDEEMYDYDINFNPYEEDEEDDFYAEEDEDEDF